MLQFAVKIDCDQLAQWNTITNIEVCDICADWLQCLNA